MLDQECGQVPDQQEAAGRAVPGQPADHHGGHEAFPAEHRGARGADPWLSPVWEAGLRGYVWGWGVGNINNAQLQCNNTNYF